MDENLKVETFPDDYLGWSYRIFNEEEIFVESDGSWETEGEAQTAAYQFLDKMRKAFWQCWNRGDQ